MQTSQSVFVFFPSHRMRFEIGNNQPVEKQLIRRDLSLVNLWSISGLLFVYFPDMNYIYSTYFHCISFLWSPQVVIWHAWSHSISSQDPEATFSQTYSYFSNCVWLCGCSLKGMNVYKMAGQRDKFDEFILLCQTCQLSALNICGVAQWKTTTCLICNPLQANKI